MGDAAQLALAIRLLGCGAAVFLLPGFALIARLDLPLRFSERLVLSFAATGVWLLLLSILLPTLRATVDVSFALTGGLLLALLWQYRRWRLPASVVRPRVSTLAFVLVIAVGGLTSAAW